jgi:hypothetical protein
MDDHLSPLQLWEAEKALICYLNEVNYYSDYLRTTAEERNAEDDEILAIDIDSSLMLAASDFALGLREFSEQVTTAEARTFLTAFHNHVTSTEDIAVATDIAESNPHITPVQDFLIEQSKKIKKPVPSLDILEDLKEVAYDIISWAELRYIHHDKDLHDAIAARHTTAMQIITHDHDIDEELLLAKDNAEMTNAFRNYFKPEFESYKIAMLNSRFKELVHQKKEGFVSKIAALTAVLYYRQVLVKTYKDTLAHLFKRLGIKDDASSYKPAQYKRKSIKGTTAENWAEANTYFDSL